MKLLRLAVFDLDGTLVELEYDYFGEETQRVFLELGAEPPERSTISSLVRSHTLFHSIPEHERESFIAEFWGRFSNERRPGARLIPHALETVQSLAHEGYEVAIATARAETADMVYEYLEPTGLHHHLSVISTFENSSDWRRDKTPQLIELCKRLKLSPREACMVGDHPTDILSAQRAGFSLKIAVLSGESDESVLKQTDPDHITHSIREVPSIIDVFHDV